MPGTINEDLRYFKLNGNGKTDTNKIEIYINNWVMRNASTQHFLIEILALDHIINSGVILNINITEILKYS